MMKKSVNIFCILLILLMSMTSAAFAEELGDGDGSGDGSDIAFALVQTLPQDGATGVSVNDSIWLLFNKNVVNATVRDINKANIVLRDSDGRKVSAAVTMKDDQIEPEYRREIVVVPSDSLDPGTTYVLTIGSAVQAKNGQTLGKTYQVTFTTAGEPPSSQQSSTTTQSQDQSVDDTNDNTSSVQDSDGDDISADQASDDDTNDAAVSEDSQSQSGQEAMDTDGTSEKTGWIVKLLAAMILLGGGATAVILIRKRRKKINL